MNIGLNVKGRKRASAKFSGNKAERVEIVGTTRGLNVQTMKVGETFIASLNSFKFNLEEYQMRSHISTSSVEAMALSLLKLGQLTPVVVLFKGENMYLVEGHRRFAGASWIVKTYSKKAEEETDSRKRGEYLAIVKKWSSLKARKSVDEKEAKAVAIASNLMREDVSEVDKYDEYREYLELIGLEDEIEKEIVNSDKYKKEKNENRKNKLLKRSTQARAAKLLNVSQPTISRWEKWRFVPSEIRTLLIETKVNNKALCNSIKNDFKALYYGQLADDVTERSLIEKWAVEIDRVNDGETLVVEKTEKSKSSFRESNFIFRNKVTGELQIRNKPLIEYCTESVENREEMKKMLLSMLEVVESC